MQYFHIMCKGMNKIFNVILGGWGATEQNIEGQSKEQKPVKMETQMMLHF